MKHCCIKEHNITGCGKRAVRSENTFFKIREAAGMIKTAEKPYVDCKHKALKLMTLP